MKTKIIAISVAVILLALRFSIAQDNTLVPVAQSEYFSVYGPSGMDVNALLRKLNFRYFLQGDTGYSAADTPKDILVKTMDALYLEVSDILGMHVYSFHGNIEIYPDQTAVGRIFQHYAQRDFSERSFYSHEKNTIYISLADLTLGMIGHEISHAVQANYFVVPPPSKVQEILSGYVEYSLQKTGKAVTKRRRK
jgi:hypothetical protein